MAKEFKIEYIDNPELFLQMTKQRSFDNALLAKFQDYHLMFEDYKTILELNKTVKDLVTGKYLFAKCDATLNVLMFSGDMETKIERIETYNTLLIQSLFTTIVVTYAKWFTTSSTTPKKPKLEVRDVFKENSIVLKTHLAMMKYRHEYFAHAGTKKHEKIYPIYISDPKNPDDDFITTVPIKKRIPELTEIRRFHRLFIHVLTHIYEKTEILRPKVMSFIRDSL
jgi:hypothetical protein